MRITRWIILAALASCTALAAGQAPARPNILWITAEDLSPNLGCYGDAYARTPHLDQFAGQGIRYTRAFATAPVCSPARSCLITGMYATSLGTQRLRSQFPVPGHLRGFAALLREEGYWTANNVKTDYNLLNEQAFIRDCWDECSAQAHWRGRKPGQPFFAVFNLMVTHQSRASVWSHDRFETQVGSQLAAEERHDPAQAPLPPFFPDTAEARRTWARYQDCITVMDKQVGALLRELAADSLDKDTIVFFFGDNGMGLPRGKRCLWDTGLREPLIVRFPESFRRLAPGVPGTDANRLVSFVDFGPTVLSLCGVDIPRHMQGVPFLGAAAGQPRGFVIGARDRVDEALDLSRSVRDQRYLYVRNFMPHLSWMPPEHFSDASTFRREFQRLRSEGKLGPEQLSYASPRKALEELYDTEADPHQIRNLADDPAHAARLKKMRTILRDWLLETRDAGFLTEPQVRARLAIAATPLEMARDDEQYPLRRLLAAADLVGRDAVREQIRLLDDPHDGVRYWAAVGLNAATTDSSAALVALRRALSDPSPVVRIEAAQALIARGETAEPLEVLLSALRAPERDVALHAARALELSGEKAKPAWPAMRQVLEGIGREKTPDDMSMFLGFSLNSALGTRVNNE